MRPTEGLLLTAAMVASAPSAWAQSAAPVSSPTSNAALLRAAFGAPAPASGLGWSLDNSAADGSPRFLGSGRSVSGLALWSSDEVALGTSAGGTDSVRMSFGQVARAHGGLITARPDSFGEPDARAVDVRYIHGWPEALKWSAAGYALDVSPHAGLGVSNFGGSAEAGAMVRFGEDLGRSVTRKLGLHEVDGASYGQRGRWYLFAAASGQAVGLNMSPGAPGLPHNSWSTESTSTLMSDAQAGIGWRKGDMQASFGYVHREIRGQLTEANNGVSPAKISDSVVAFSLSIHPH